MTIFAIFILSQHSTRISLFALLFSFEQRTWIVTNRNFAQFLQIPFLEKCLDWHDSARHKHSSLSREFVFDSIDSRLLTELLPFTGLNSVYQYLHFSSKIMLALPIPSVALSPSISCIESEQNENSASNKWKIYNCREVDGSWGSCAPLTNLFFFSFGGTDDGRWINDWNTFALHNRKLHAIEIEFFGTIMSE